MHRRRRQLAAFLALLLIAAAWGGLAYRSGGSSDVRAVQATQAAPVPVSAPREARPAAAPRQVPVRPPRPGEYGVKARATPPVLALDAMRELDAAPVAAAAPPPRRVSLKLLESIASFDSAAPADGARAPGAPTESADRRYLVFVNQCDDHAPASAEYRRCRAAEVRRLAFACGFYQRELRTVAYARASDAEAWMQAYCHKMDAYKAAAR